jgi:hypothetical protein
MKLDVAADKLSASRISAVLFAARLNREVVGAIDEIVQINGEKYGVATRKFRSARKPSVIAGNGQAGDVGCLKTETGRRIGITEGVSYPPTRCLDVKAKASLTAVCCD